MLFGAHFWVVYTVMANIVFTIVVVVFAAVAGREAQMLYNVAFLIYNAIVAPAS